VTGRVLGVDFGERRIGLAVSDPTGTIAQPLPTLLRRRGKRAPVSALAELVRSHEVRHIVVGLPLTPKGEANAWTEETRKFGAALEQRTGVPVSYADERYTSAAAERAVRALALPKHERERKERIDAAAAVLILQFFLDTQRVQNSTMDAEGPDR
jgi:putative Holliday junction resolvase